MTITQAMAMHALRPRPMHDIPNTLSTQKVLRVQRVQRVHRGHKGRTDQRVLLDKKGHKVYLETKDLRVLQVPKVLQDRKDPKAKMGNRDLKESAVRAGEQDHADKQDHRGPRDPKVPVDRTVDSLLNASHTRCSPLPFQKTYPTPHPETLHKSRS